MGVGDPVGIVEAIACGVDLFDCVLPTRFGRHGTILTSRGRASTSRTAGSPTTPARSTLRARARSVPGTRGPTCATWSTSTSRRRPACSTLHNLAWTLALTDRARDAVFAGHARRPAGRGRRRLRVNPVRDRCTAGRPGRGVPDRSGASLSRSLPYPTWWLTPVALVLLFVMLALHVGCS